MTDTNPATTRSCDPSSITNGNGLPAESTIASVEHGHVQVGRLLERLQQSAPLAAEAPCQSASHTENELAEVRLGIATSLFYALRAKHAPTAAHCLRVSLCCSAWAERLGMTDGSRDRLEVAALLHDLGKIGIPDRILRKPGKLSVDEQLSMDCCAQLGCEILRGCTDDQALLDIIRYAGTWFESRRKDDGPSGDALPIGSRMISIADAFDAMTTDTVYRPARSRERAIQELLDGSGTQFDPDLAIDFHRMLEERPEMLQGAVVNRWLQRLRSGSDESMWGPATSAMSETTGREAMFYRQLIGNMKDGVVFTDAEGVVTQWNDVMHQLTGIGPDAVVGQQWNGPCFRICETDPSHDDSCLVNDCLSMGSTIARPMLIEHSANEPTPIQVEVSPVFGSTPGVHGAVVIVRDQSDRSDLEAQLESLHRQTTRDPLTGVANRACFDKTLAELISSTESGGAHFSLIISDIDHFKRVNDVHGHPAGDEALVSFAAILDSHSRDGDLVARYGGEEFLLLAPNCDNATAAKRAEAIRHTLERSALPSLGGEAVTASFGVTEFQPGDSSETIVARADRALLKAKDNGRNRVVQLGSGQQVDLEQTKSKKGWLNWFGGDEKLQDGDFDIATNVPIHLTIDKLRGFIADHHAEIISVDEDQISMKLLASAPAGGRRRIDHRVALRLRLTLSEIRHEDGDTQRFSKSNVHVHVQPIRNRDRRCAELPDCFAQVLHSLRSYLMGEFRDSQLG